MTPEMTNEMTPEMEHGRLRAAADPRHIISDHHHTTDCRVHSGHLLEDLCALASADLLAISSSGFSVLAYYLRPLMAPTLVPMRHVAQFFTAADGSDGRSRKRVSTTPREAPPPNLWFVGKLLEALEANVLGDLANSSGAASVGFWDSPRSLGRMELIYQDAGVQKLTHGLQTIYAAGRPYLSPSPYAES